MLSSTRYIFGFARNIAAFFLNARAKADAYSIIRKHFLSGANSVKNPSSMLRWAIPLLVTALSRGPSGGLSRKQATFSRNQTYRLSAGSSLVPSARHNTKRLSVTVLAMLFAMLSFAPRCIGQITQMDDETSTPKPGSGHDYLQLGAETVSPATGSVSIRIGLPLPKGRQMSLPLYIAYDSGSSAHIAPDTSSMTVCLEMDSGVPGVCTESGIQTLDSLGYAGNAAPFSVGGWNYTIPFVNYSYVDHLGNPQNGGGTFISYSNYMFHDPSGGNHALPIGAFTLIEGTQPPVFTVGGDSEYQGYFSGGGNYDLFKVSGNSGSTYSFENVNAELSLPLPIVETAAYSSVLNTTYRMASTVEDTNGNIESYSYPQTGEVVLSDTLGRTAISVNGFATSQDTITVAGASAPYYVKWQSLTPTGNLGGSIQLPGGGTTTGPGGTTCSFGGGLPPELVIRACFINRFGLKVGTSG